jgi:hypothetical protein
MLIPGMRLQLPGGNSEGNSRSEFQKSEQQYRVQKEDRKRPIRPERLVYQSGKSEDGSCNGRYRLPSPEPGPTQSQGIGQKSDGGQPKTSTDSGDPKCLHRAVAESGFAHGAPGLSVCRSRLHWRTNTPGRKKRQCRATRPDRIRSIPPALAKRHRRSEIPVFSPLNTREVGMGRQGSVTDRMGILGELFRFLWARKLWWLLPMIIVLIAIVLLLVFAQGSAVAPFIYTLF